MRIPRFLINGDGGIVVDEDGRRGTHPGQVVPADIRIRNAAPDRLQALERPVGVTPPVGDDRNDVVAVRESIVLPDPAGQAGEVRAAGELGHGTEIDIRPVRLEIAAHGGGTPAGEDDVGVEVPLRRCVGDDGYAVDVHTVALDQGIEQREGTGIVQIVRLDVAEIDPVIDRDFRLILRMLRLPCERSHKQEQQGGEQICQGLFHLTISMQIKSRANRVKREKARARVKKKRRDGGRCFQKMLSIFPKFRLQS